MKTKLSKAVFFPRRYKLSCCFIIETFDIVLFNSKVNISLKIFLNLKKGSKCNIYYSLFLITSTFITKKMFITSKYMYICQTYCNKQVQNSCHFGIL